MVLLVVGLVVIVLVILVVVFLSVRSMRGDEGDDYSVRRPEARRQSAGARSAGAGLAGGRTAAARTRTDDRRADRRRGLDGDGYGHDDGYGRTAVMTARDYGGARAYRDDAPDPRDRDHGQARRRGGPAAADRARGDRTRADRAGSDRSEADRTGSAAAQRRLSGLPRPRAHQHGEELDSRDWAGVSDEQYWAELSADKPLATTARSAGPANDPRQARPALGTSDDATPSAAAPAGRRARRDSAAPPPTREPAPTMAAAGTPTTQFSLRSESGPSAWPPASPDHWTDPGAGGPETDPTIGGPRGWQEPAADSWDRADDPLTSPSFTAPGAHGANTASYLDEHASGYGSSWDSRGRHEAAPQYEGGADDWRAWDHEYRAGLPGPAGTSADWYPAPTAEPGYPPAESWDHEPAGYPARDNLSAGHGAGQSRYDWDQPGQHEPGHGSAGYQAGHRAYSGEPSGYGSSGAGYDFPDPLGDGDSDPSGYRPDGTGYQLPDYGSAGDRYHADGGSRLLDRHGSADAGYQQGYDRSGGGYEIPDTAPYEASYGSAGNGYGLPDLNGYQLPGHDHGTNYLPNGHAPAGYRAGHDRDGGHGTGNGYIPR